MKVRYFFCFGKQFARVGIIFHRFLTSVLQMGRKNWKSTRDKRLLEILSCTRFSWRDRVQKKTVKKQVNKIYCTIVHKTMFSNCFTNCNSLFTIAKYYLYFFKKWIKDYSDKNFKKIFSLQPKGKYLICEIIERNYSLINYFFKDNILLKHVNNTWDISLMKER